MDTKISLLLECRKKLEQAAALAEEVRQMEINGIQQPNNPPITFEIAEGKISYVAMVIATMIDMKWIIAKDEKGKEIKNTPRRDAGNWMGRYLFGKPFKKWDQLVEYCFRWREKREKEKFLEVFDRLKTVAGRRISKD